MSPSASTETGANQWMKRPGRKQSLSTAEGCYGGIHQFSLYIDSMMAIFNSDFDRIS